MTAKTRWRRAVGLDAALAALLVTLSLPARADVAIVVIGSGAPAARGAEPDATHLAMTDLDGAVPITMVSERVELDLYPTLLVVDATFVMHADETVDELLVAFPEQLEDMLEPTPGLFGLSVEVDGVVVELERGARLRGTCSSEADFYWARESWWAWPMRAVAGRDHEIRVRYAQRVDPFERQQLRYVLRTGASWSGPIGHGEIELQLHGVAREQLDIHWPRLDGAQLDGSSAPVRWSFDDLEPDEDVEIGLQSTSRRPYPPVEYAEYPTMPAHELLLRASLLRWEPDPVDEWERILALLRELERESEVGRRTAAELREEIVLALIDRATHLEALSFGPDVEALAMIASQPSHGIPTSLAAELFAAVEKVGGDPASVERLWARAHAERTCDRPAGTCVDGRPSLVTAPLDPACLPRPLEDLFPLPDWQLSLPPGSHDSFYGLVVIESAIDEPVFDDRRGPSWTALALAGLLGSLALGGAFVIRRRRRG